MTDPHAIDRMVTDVVRDTGRTIGLFVISQDGTRHTGFDPLQNTLTAQMWAGDDSPPLVIAGLIAEWVSAAAGQYQLHIPPLEDVITSATYWVRVRMVTDDDRDIEIYRTKVRVIDAPGENDTLLETYCSYRDVLDHAPWIDSLQTDTDRSGFLRQRTAAKNWMDHAITKRAKTMENSWHDSTNYIHYGVVPPDWAYSRYIARLIWDAKIIVSPRMREVAAYYTIHLICETQLSPQGAYGPYLDASRRMIGKAQQMLETTVIEFDQDGDGEADLAVEMGSVSDRGST